MTHADSVSRAHKSTAVLFLLIALLLLSAATSASAKTINALNTEGLKIALRQINSTDQTKIAEPGDTIILTAGETYEGPFILPNLPNPNGLYIIIQSSSLTTLADGKRVSPSDGTYMPKLIAPPLQQALETATIGVNESFTSYFKIIGIEFTFRDEDGPTDDGLTVYTIIRLGQSSATSATQQPSNLIIDRCYVHGQPTRGSKNGIELNSRGTSITNSYISDIHSTGQANGIAGWNGPGPFNIINNYIEAAGFNIAFGGALPLIPGLIPSNIEIRRNHLFKPTKWRPGSADYTGILWHVKGHFELKSAKFVTVEGNLIENNWNGSYGAINLTAASDSGTQATIQNIDVRHNIVRKVPLGVLVKGWVGDDPATQGHHVRIYNNVFEGVDNGWVNDGGTWLLAGEINDLVVDHNTAFSTYGILLINDPAIPRPKMSGFVLSNNIVTFGSYGILAPGYGPTDAAIQNWFSQPYSITKNVIIDPGQHQSSYPQTVTEPPNYWRTSVADLYFVDYANQNYRLASNSPFKTAATDYKAIGADIDAIVAAMGGRQSLSLDGTNDYALVNDSDSLSVEGPITVEAWFKVDSIGSYQTIVAKESFQVAGTGGGYELQITNTGKVRGNFYQSHTAYTVVAGTTTVSTGVWHHAAVTFDGTTRRLFLDGALEASIAGASAGPIAGAGNLRIGRRNSGTNTYYFNGLVDEVRVSNAALYSANFTPEAILTPTATTKGLWKFDAGTADDSSANANNGTLQGGATYSTDVPLANPHSLSLNGTNAYALVNHSSGLAVEGPITVEAWFKVDSIGTYQTIVAKESYAVVGTGGGYELQVTNTGKVRGNFYQSHNTYTVVAGTTTITTGVWHHVAVTFDGTTRRIFLDGALEASIAGATGGPIAGSGNLRIGRRNHSTNTYYFGGLIDEVRVSNAALYSSNFTPETSLTTGSSTKGLWKFDDQTATDSSGNGYDGTLQGGAAFSTDVP